MGEKTPAKIILFCPSGHRVRGGTDLLDKRVKCPRCEVVFVFGSPAADALPGGTVTGHSAGAGRLAAGSPVSGATNPSASPVFESQVMKILGEMDHEPAPPPPPPSPHPCPQCGGDVTLFHAVCPHCKSFVDVLPRFMSELD